MMLQAEIDASK